MKNAISYCRVSTKEQADTGFSLESQNNECRKFALNNGYSIDKVFIERGESAKTTDRTQLIKLIEYAVKNKKTINALIIWKFDRLARNLDDQIELLKKFRDLNIRTLSVTENNEDNSTGKLMRNIIGSFAQYENDIKSERTIKGMQQALKEGRWCWHAPVGYRFEKDNTGRSLLVYSDKANIIKSIFEDYAKGIYSQLEVLNKYKKDIKLTKNTFNRLLRNNLYTGIIIHKWLKELVKALHKPIIEEDLFYKVQNVLEGRRPQITPKQKNHPDFPLRRFVKCKFCGRALTASWSKGRKNKYPYYHCLNKNCKMYLRKEKVEKDFYNILITIKPKDEMISLFEAIILDVWKKQNQEIKKATTKLEKELESLEEKNKRIDELMIKGTFDEETFKSNKKSIRDLIETKRLDLEENKNYINNPQECIEYCKRVIKNLPAIWQASDINLKQRFQSLVFPENLYYDGKSFGTNKMSLIFNVLSNKSTDKFHLVSPTQCKINYVN